MGHAVDEKDNLPRTRVVNEKVHFRGEKAGIDRGYRAVDAALPRRDFLQLVEVLQTEAAVRASALTPAKNSHRSAGAIM